MIGCFLDLLSSRGGFKLNKLEDPFSRRNCRVTIRLQGAWGGISGISSLSTPAIWFRLPHLQMGANPRSLHLTVG